MKTYVWHHFIIFFLVLGIFSFTTVKKKKSTKKTGSKTVVSPRNSTPKNNPYYIIVDKSDYELRVYDEEGWYATYPVVFGSKDQNDKYMEGDKKTPEGKFKVLLKKIHPKWGPELLLDYPNEESIKKFNERQSRGLIPRNARI